MAPITLRVPTISDSLAHFDGMFHLWSAVNDDSLDVTFDFSPCRFLRHHAVAFLGGLARLIQWRGGQVTFAWNTLRDNIRTNLAQQGFCAAFGEPGGSWIGNSIPYREDSQQDVHQQMDYLKSKWLGRGWVNVSDRLRDEIVGKVWESYENGFEHSASPIGVIACGQRYPKVNELGITLVDFGVGIPSNVRVFKRQPFLTAGSALQWAFQAGTSTKASGVNRGMGLLLLKDFIRKNQGRLEVFSHDGYGKIDAEGESYHARAIGFEGTLVNIVLKCDDKLYYLASEVAEEPFF